MRVLIALNITAQSQEIVNELASRPWPAGTLFLLLHILDPYPFSKAPLSLKRVKEAAGVELKSAATRLCEAGWKTETEVVIGIPRRAVSEIAASWRADLVIVGSNDAGVLMRLFLGSTARSVLRHAPCAVEIVRPSVHGKKDAQPMGIKILVATDGSEYSTAAIQSVASRPWPKDSVAKVVSVPEPFMPLGEFPYFELREIEELNAAALNDAKRYAEAGAEMLSKAGLNATAETLRPSESDAREIVKEAARWEAQLVVLGSHGRRGFDRLTTGSVAEHVAMHAPCSVEVIRAPLVPNAQAKNISKKGAMP